MKTYENAFPAPFATELYNYALDRAEGADGGYHLTHTWLSNIKWDDDRLLNSHVPTFGIELPKELKEKTTLYLRSHKSSEVVDQLTKRFKANLCIASQGAWVPPTKDTKQWFIIYLNRDWKFSFGGHLQWQIEDKSWKVHNPNFNTLAWNDTYDIYSRTPITETPQVFLELTF